MRDILFSNINKNNKKKLQYMELVQYNQLAKALMISNKKELICF